MRKLAIAAALALSILNPVPAHAGVVSFAKHTARLAVFVPLSVIVGAVTVPTLFVMDEVFGRSIQ